MKIKFFVANKLPEIKQTNDIENYAKKNNLEIINCDNSDNIKPKDEFHNLLTKKQYKNGLKDVIIYARFSSSNQNEISITGQVCG